MVSSVDLPICTACGTQFDDTTVKNCHICDDPRQFIPISGQSFTSLSKLRAQSYSNKFKPFDSDNRFISIWTEPKLAIGQRCVLLRTPAGNVLWDCITYLDDATVNTIQDMGGIAAIVISHPHYYSTHLEWAAAFGCKVYVAADDAQWLCRRDEVVVRSFVQDTEHEIQIAGVGSGVKALKLGGHFPGSLVCLWEGRLLVADTLVTVPSGLYHVDRPAGTSSFAFMWSIPNMIPLGPDAMLGMWRVLKKYSFGSTHGAFVGLDIIAKDVKEWVLESMKIQCRSEEYKDHPLLKETCEL